MWQKTAKFFKNHEDYCTVDEPQYNIGLQLKRASALIH